jgi:hypothetical protein
MSRRVIPERGEHILRWSSNSNNGSRGRLGRLCRWCTRAVHGLAWRAGHLDVDPIVAFLALELAIVLVLLAAVARRRLFRLDLRLGLGWRGPAGELPDDPSEALDPEAALLPLAAGLARPVEGPQASIYSTLIGLGAEFMSRCGCIRSSCGGAVIDRTVLPMIIISK